MVYLEPHQLSWRPLLASWLATLPRALGDRIIQRVSTLINYLLPPCLEFVRKECTEFSPTQPSALAVTAMRIFEALLDDYVGPKGEQEEGGAPPGAMFEEGTKALQADCYTLLATVWAIGRRGGLAAADSSGAARSCFRRPVGF